MLKSKIHRATVTDADLNYIGSITIDQDLIEAANIWPNEKVQIVNNNNGARFETYVISGERGSGVMCLNGAAARMAQKGDVIIIISYGVFTEDEARKYKADLVFVDGNNRITSTKKGTSLE
jgi:aspartate 1-decarboxylase